MIDISVLPAQSTEDEIKELAAAADKYGFIAAFALPHHIGFLKSRMPPGSKVILGAPIGFPTGADLSQDKRFQVKEMMAMGCTEFDMVISIGKLKSGRMDYVKDDIAGVIDTADGYPVKVILEVTYLTDGEIVAASEIVAQSGAEYVKTGTGYSIKPTEVRHVELMKKTVGDRIKIKVAGGVRDLDSLKAFYEAGARRFGIGMKAAIDIVKSVV